MAATRGRTGYAQTLSASGTWDTIFDAGLDGQAPRIMRFSCTVQDVLLEVNPVHTKADGSLTSVRLIAGDPAIEIAATRASQGYITKVRAQAVTTGAVLNWDIVLL